MLTNESRDEPGDTDRRGQVTTTRDLASAPVSVTDPPPAAANDRSGKIFVAGFIAFAAIVVAYFVLGMPGMDHGSDSGSSMAGMDMGASSSPHHLATPDEFEAQLNESSVTVINVHTPYEGEIEGTDLFMPFDALDSALLPADRSTKLLVYCRTGSMSATASADLVDMGYTNVVELDGGMHAWDASNRGIVADSSSSSG